MPEPRPIEAIDHGLMATDDPEVWSQEFCRIFSGYMIGDDLPDAHLSKVDSGTMVGWFANAMQVAVNLYELRKRRATEAQKDAFVEGFLEGRPEEV